MQNIPQHDFVNLMDFLLLGRQRIHYLLLTLVYLTEVNPMVLILRFVTRPCPYSDTLFPAVITTLRII